MKRQRDKKTDGFTRYEFDAALVAKALKDEEFRKELLSRPTETYQRELGRKIPAEAKIVVVVERADTFYVVLPHLPPECKHTDEQIERVARHIATHRDPCWGVGDPVE